jgi:AcrR family transcriptional regulator
VVAKVQGLGRREQAKAERRLRIIGAARDLIRETGDTDLSMRTIAKRAKVSLATPYNLFGSKRAVVLAVLEDERDFAERFASLHPVNAIERIFQALTLAVGYYADDPDFYRTLWRALLDTNGKDGAGLATPQRRAQTHALWRTLLENAQRQDFLEGDISLGSLERNLSYAFNGVMLSWVMGGLTTNEMLPAAGYAYALALQGAATKNGRERLSKKVALYQKQLARTQRRAAAA